MTDSQETQCSALLVVSAPPPNRRISGHVDHGENANLFIRDEIKDGVRKTTKNGPPHSVKYVLVGVGTVGQTLIYDVQFLNKIATKPGLLPFIPRKGAANVALGQWPNTYKESHFSAKS